MAYPRDPNNGVAPIIAAWPVADIVYVSIVGPIMLMALLEWILFLLAFLYCFFKVFVKADENKWSIRILCVVASIFFIVMRCVFLPVMAVTLPLPPQVVQYFPEEFVSVLQWFAFYTFASLLVVPWLLCVYQLVTQNVGRQRRIKTVLDEYSAPKVAIIMPCYNEEPDILLRTVDSIVDCEYPPSCLHVFLSFDGDAENELYLNTIEKLGVPLTLNSYPKSIDVKYRGCRITVSRFPHGGKRSCQKKTYRLIDKLYAEYLRRNDNLFLLFIDSDCILDKVCIQNFMYEMELKPGSKHSMLAMTGVITSTTVKNSLITVLQDMEYIHGQLFERSVESSCGAVTCLPGALTMLRFSAFRRMAKYYFADKAEQCDDLFDYAKCHLGEDRWLTHLFMIGAQERYQIQMNTGAFCKTEAVQTYKSLLKQRRRWFLGYITNEVCMLTDIRLWKRYPLLLTIRLAQNTIRTTALLFFIMVISIISTSQKVAHLPVGFIGVSLGLNWVIMLYFGAKLGRYKIMFYPLMFVVNPFFNWLYMTYGCFTAGQRTWGGPRADAGKADQNTSPAQVVEEAKANGDELNVLPETFKPATGIARRRSGRNAPLLPSSHLEGRFAPAEQLPGGWYQQMNDSGALHADMTHRDPGDIETMLRYKGPNRDSTDSFMSSSNSVYTPRRVESFMATQDAFDYHAQQEGQRPAGGAFFESRITPERGGMLPNDGTGPLAVANPRYAASQRSLESDSDVSLHFDVPRPPTEAARGQSSVAPLQIPVPRPTPQMIERRRSRSANAVAAPPQSHQPSGRFYGGDQSSQRRTARSPLARESFTRLASDDAPSTARTSTELGARLPTRPSIDDEDRRGRRRRTSIGPDGRRRLSKQGRHSRSSSRA